MVFLFQCGMPDACFNLIISIWELPYCVLNEMLTIQNIVIYCYSTVNHTLYSQMTPQYLIHEFDVWVAHVCIWWGKCQGDHTVSAYCIWVQPMWRISIMATSLHWLLLDITIDNPVVDNNGWVNTRTPSQYKDLLSRYGHSHVKDKMVMRPSYL